MAILAIICSRLSARSRQQAVYFVTLAGVLLGNAATELVAPGRPIFERGLFLPGSPLGRWLHLLLPPGLSGVSHRALEPVFWVTSFVLLRLPRPFVLPWLLLVALFGLEIFQLSRFSGTQEAASSVLPALHGLVFWGFWIALFLACTRCLIGNSPTHRMRVCQVLFLSQAGLLIALHFAANGNGRKSAPIGLAHYYSWFPENWQAGFPGAELEPPLEPALGRYASASPPIVHQHAEWAREAGINCFILDWWPSRRQQNMRVLQAAKQFDETEKICTVLLYETLDLRQPHERRMAGERENIVFLSEKRAEGMAKQWVRLVKDYMQRPLYMRIRNRPVLFLYATRHLVGDVARRLDEARAYVRNETGEDLYLIGDEIYFEVPSGDGVQLKLLSRYQANWDRLRAFDAIFAYNPYDPSRKEHAGRAGAERYLRDTAELFRQYRRIAATLGIAFMPTAMPGYNDRAHRLAADHFVIPRKLLDNTSMLRRTLAHWVCPSVSDSSFPYFAITSWNEWNEGSQVEPTAARNTPLAGNPHFSFEESYEAYERAHIRELAEFSSRAPSHCPAHPEE